MVARLGLLVVASIGAFVSGCADDVVPGSTQGPIATGSDTGGAITTNLVTGLVDDGVAETDDGSGSSADDTGGSTTGTDTGDGTDTGTTGDPPADAQTQSQLVSSGRQMESSSYRMVYTMGQPSQLQPFHSSANYQLHGGLVGANGSPP